MTERGSLFYTRCGTFHKGMDNLNGLHFFLKCYIVKVRFGGRIKRLQALPHIDLLPGISDIQGTDRGIFRKCRWTCLWANILKSCLTADRGRHPARLFSFGHNTAIKLRNANDRASFPVQSSICSISMQPPKNAI